jgi:UDP:flavonoid glycosyltransferase YjiC (YdhE family)
MRVLVATTAGAGHFGPLVPFAAALQGAGHDVAVAAPASFAGAVARAGFDFLPFDDASSEELGRVFASLPALSHEEANARVVGDVFGRIDTRAALPGMRATVAEWRPDLVVRESCEFSSYLVAEAAGIPHVHVAVGLARFGRAMLPVIEAPLTELGAEPGLAGLRAAPTFTLTPRSFEDPADTGGDDLRRFRDGTRPAGGGQLPDWWAGAGDPLVYVTFGSVAATIGLFPALYQEVAAILAGQPVRALLTLGEGGHPEALGSVPGNVHVEQWWPQEQVMAQAAAMVGHGGFGTTLAGLAAGLPMVVLPLFADQPDNAARVQALGAGVALEGGAGAVGSQLGPALEAVLTNPAYKEAALQVADEIRQLPPAETAVPIIEALAR